MATSAPMQDMPPPGGYGPISFKRIPARTHFKGWKLFVGFFALKFTSIYIYYNNYLRYRYTQIEDRSARLAITPLLEAEKDRGLLKQLRLNREEEGKLMANVPNWEVGKLYDEPLFKTVPEGSWIEPTGMDFFPHAPANKITDRIYFNWFH